MLGPDQASGGARPVSTTFPSSPKIVSSTGPLPARDQRPTPGFPRFVKSDMGRSKDYSITPTKH